ERGGGDVLQRHIHLQTNLVFPDIELRVCIGPGDRRGADERSAGRRGDGAGGAAERRRVTAEIRTANPGEERKRRIANLAANIEACRTPFAIEEEAVLERQINEVTRREDAE